MSKRFSTKAIGILTGVLALATASKDAAAVPSEFYPELTPSAPLDERPMLFIDAGSPDAAGQMLAAHRSHSSHRSHKSHYSSRGGGGYSRSAPVYTPPVTSKPAAPSTSSSPSTRTSPTTGVAGSAVAQQADLIREIQEGLAKLGYTPGSADGKLGKGTKKAIAMFQADQGLTINGEPSQNLLIEIRNEIKKR